MGVLDSRNPQATKQSLQSMGVCMLRLITGDAAMSPPRLPAVPHLDELGWVNSLSRQSRPDADAAQAAAHRRTGCLARIELDHEVRAAWTRANSADLELFAFAQRRLNQAGARTGTVPVGKWR